MIDREAIAELHRVGVIDIGSNSVRLVIFDGAARSPAYFYNEKVLCGLGRDIAETGLLHPEGRDRALRALDRFKAICDQAKVQSLTAVATAAVREASDGPAFCAQVKQRTGIEIDVASGLEEARLSAQGVLLGWPTAQGLVCDIGGASMELAEVADGAVGRRETSPLGPLKLANVTGGEVGLLAHIDAEIATLQSKINGTYDHLFLVGGSYRAIANIDMSRRNYPLDVLHEYKITPADLNETLDWIIDADNTKLETLSTAPPERLRLVPIAARVLKSLIRAYDPKGIAISSYGLREGMLYERMPPELRKLDPLIEACKWMEHTNARFPGFGAAMADWVTQVIPNPSPKRARLIDAAALLHDVSWRADPSFRAEVCFDNATRANMGGLDHVERVFLGMALLHRYKNNGKMGRYQKLGGILSEEQRQAALAIGYTMRLGAALACGSRQVLQATRLTLTENTLELSIPPQYHNLNGEAVIQRFGTLAEALNREPVIVST
ncbi:MAG: Ppx/GppA family phosphatase [Rhodobacteraceae bacterium]|nr:Ppx/GppA family phosphatase [Paracoccaceae bacterium]